MKKKLLSMLLAVSMSLGLMTCSTNVLSEAAETGTEAMEQSDIADNEIQEEASGTRIFVDDCGRGVEVPDQVSRIVASGPLAQIILLGIAPDMLVGLASEFYDSARGIVPDELFDLPYFGQLYGSANLNVEELAAVGPELIIDIGEAKDGIQDDLNGLEEQTTIPAVFVSATLDTMPETFRTLGELLGRQEKGEQLAQFCEKIYSRTVSIMEEVGEENKVNALYITGEEGLNVLAKGSYHAELIDMLVNNLAVVDNPVSKGTGNEVSMDQILLWNPDYIIFAPGSIYSEVSEMDTWDSITAIAQGQYIETPDVPHNWMGTPPSVQRYLGMIWLTAELYPEYCDYDVKEDVKEYYELFYGCELTDEQYEEIIANAVLN